MMKDADNPFFISVIIPVLNGELTIQRCLDSLLSQEYSLDCYEIIVVDNGSTDGTKEIILKINDKRISLFEELGVQSAYAARNLGILKAKGEILAFTDSDCVAQKDWLRKIAFYFQDSSIGEVGGEIKAFSPQTLIEQYQDDQKFLSQSYLAKGPFGIFSVTANVAYRKNAFSLFGLFDPDLVSGGDVEFSRRLRLKSDYRVMRANDVVVYHNHRNSFEGLWKQRYRDGYGCGLLIKKNRSFKPFLLVESPFFYFLPGFVYFLSIWFIDIIFNIKKNKEIILFRAWIDFYGEIAFRFGYQKSKKLNKKL